MDILDLSDVLVLMLVNLNQQQAGAEDGEGMRPSTDTGEGLEEIN